jgi:hypothetical protein
MVHPTRDPARLDGSDDALSEVRSFLHASDRVALTAVEEDRVGGWILSSQSIPGS